MAAEMRPVKSQPTHDILMMYAVRIASLPDVPQLARHRVAMFRDMGTLAAGSEAPLAQATETYLRHALPGGEYVAWVAESTESPPAIIGGAGAQLRPILPRPGAAVKGIELGPEAIILNVYVEPSWRRRGVAEALMRALLGVLAVRGIRRVVLHASPDGRRLYERLGFRPTNEMQLIPQPGESVHYV